MAIRRENRVTGPHLAERPNDKPFRVYWGVSVFRNEHGYFEAVRIPGYDLFEECECEALAQRLANARLSV